MNLTDEDIAAISAVVAQEIENSGEMTKADGTGHALAVAKVGRAAQEILSHAETIREMAPEDRDVAVAEWVGDSALRKAVWGALGAKIIDEPEPKAAEPEPVEPMGKSAGEQVLDLMKADDEKQEPTRFTRYARTGAAIGATLGAARGAVGGFATGRYLGRGKKRLAAAGAVGGAMRGGLKGAAVGIGAWALTTPFQKADDGSLAKRQGLALRVLDRAGSIVGNRVRSITASREMRRASGPNGYGKTIAANKMRSIKDFPDGYSDHVKRNPGAYAEDYANNAVRGFSYEAGRRGFSAGHRIGSNAAAAGALSAAAGAGYYAGQKSVEKSLPLGELRKAIPDELRKELQGLPRHEQDLALKDLREALFEFDELAKTLDGAPRAKVEAAVDDFMLSGDIELRKFVPALMAGLSSVASVAPYAAKVGRALMAAKKPVSRAYGAARGAASAIGGSRVGRAASGAASAFNNSRIGRAVNSPATTAASFGGSLGVSAYSERQKQGM